MKHIAARCGFLVPFALALAACGSGGGDSPPTRMAGAFDTGFGASGVLETAGPYPGFVLAARHVAIDASGRLLVAGTVAPPATSQGTGAFYARVLPAGSLDAGFGEAGFVPLNATGGYRFEGRFAFPAGDDRTMIVSQQFDTCQGSPDACPPRPAMVGFRRLQADGRLDGAWGVSNYGPQELLDAVFLPDGSIVFLTRISGAPGAFSLALRRMRADGTPDGAFSGAADLAIRCGGSAAEPAHLGRLARLADGRLLVARYSLSPVGGGAPRQCVIRLFEDGSLDKDFGEQGYLRFDDARVGIAETVAVLERSDGVVALVSNRQVGIGAYDSAIAWVRRDGALDPALGRDGISAPLPVLGRVTAAAIQPDDGILLAGLSGDPSSLDVLHPFDYRPRLVRLLPAGTLDGEFGPLAVGYVPLAVPGTTRWILPFALALASDGSIYAAGQSATDLGPYSFLPRSLAIAKLAGRAR